MSEDLEKVFTEAITGIKKIKPFPYDDYANRLHNKVRMTFPQSGSQEHLRDFIERAPTYPEDDPDPDNSLIDIFAIYDLLHKVSVPSASDGVASVEDSLDSEGLKQYVSQENSVVRYLEVLTNLMGFCLGEHINRELKSQNTKTIDDLWHCGNFQEFIKEAVTRDSFIMNEIRTDMARQDHLFSIAWLMIVDYMQDRDHVYRTAPCAGIDFQDKASYRTLNQWSYSLWSNHGKGDTKEMDEIVKFCGRVATIGLCPPNATTGLQQPAATWKVTKAFYDMGLQTFEDDNYNTELQESLKRLQDQEEIVNEWKSYCLALTSSWQNEIAPYWRTGMYRAFKAAEFEAVKMWEYGAYEDQNDLFYWGIDYLPVVRQPWIGFKSFASNIILPKTLLTLGNGTMQPVEDLRPEDQVLVHRNPEISTTVRTRPVGNSETVKLIGFNKETPWAQTSQVFHTTTGLRAVDPEAAQRINSYRRIGKLAVGHILLRLQGSTYESVEIKSIEHGEDRLPNGAFALSLLEGHQTYHAYGYLVDTNSANHTFSQTAQALRKVPGNKRLGLLSHCQELWAMFKRFDVQTLHQRLNWEIFGRHKSPDGYDPHMNVSASPFNYTEHIKMTNALNVSKGIPIDRITRGFRLKAHNPKRLPTGYQLPSMGLVDGYLLLDDEAQLQSKYDAQKRLFRWTRELRHLNTFEHGSFRVDSRATSGTGVIHLSSDSQAQGSVNSDQAYSFEAEACGIDRVHDTKSISAKADDDWMPFGSWKVTLDRNPWPADTERTEPEVPIDGGVFEDGYWPGDVKVVGMSLKDIEQLRDQINQNFDQQLGDFYDVTSRFADGLSTYIVRFRRAPLVPFVSDAGLDIGKTFDIGFKSDLSIDTEIPTLFQEMTFTMDAMYETFTGYFFTYDPTKRGYRGDRHLIQGTLKESDAVRAYRAKVSRAYSSVSNCGEVQVSNERLQPAPITEKLLAFAEPSINDLVQFTGYQEKSLHNDTQLLIRSMMYYHMDDTHREKILQVPKPTVPQELPSALADNLPSKLKTFFKERYGPAFICRYVGRTQKYMKSFTDQEMKNLWYWWQGNGKTSLSQSEEYNDINRLASREAMSRRYESNLEPYLNDNPDAWAQKLFESITNNKHLMLNWAIRPIGDDGNNVINKQCNILDALSPSADWSQKFFDNFMAFALTQGVSSADIEPGDDQDQKYNWLHDSMKDLILAILNDDDSISKDIKEGLLRDIEEFEKQNGLNQQADMEDRANAILEKSSILMQELSGWFSNIGKGLEAAFGGTALWKSIGKAFDKAAEKVSSIPAVTKLKGLSSIAMVGINLAMAMVSLWSLVQNWDSLSDAQRAVVIFEATRMVVSSIDKSIDAFNDYKSKPASTPADEFNMEALNDGLTEEIMEKSNTMGDIAQEITGEEDYRTAIGENIQGEAMPRPSEGEESWNQAIEDIDKEIPPGYEDAAKKFNISGNMLRVLNALLGIGLVIAMSFSLAADWDSLSDTGKVLGILNMVVQGLTVLLDVIDVGTEIGLWAVTGTMSVALPILGAVLAVLGVVLMIVQLFINIFIGRQEPPDPIADFIDDVGHEVISTFETAPQPKLTYSISSSSASAGQVTTLTITGKNTSSSDVTISYAQITLYSGNDDVCLFRNGADDTANISLVLDTDAGKQENGHTYVTPSSVTNAQLPQPSRLGTESTYYEYNLQAAGPVAEASNGLKQLVVKAGESFQSVWTAKVNGRGDDSEKSTSWIEVVEAVLKDKCQTQFLFQRL